MKTIRSCLENVSTISVARQEQSWIQYKLNDEELRNGCCVGLILMLTRAVPENMHKSNPLLKVKLYWLLVFQTQWRSWRTFPWRMYFCPNQCRENRIMIDTRSKIYCNEMSAEMMECPEFGIRIPIQHHGLLPFIPVRRPTMEETLTCDYINVTSDANWEPYGDHSPTHSGISKISSAHPMRQGKVTEDLDHICNLLMGRNLDTLFSKGRFLAEVTSQNGEPDFRSIEAVTARRKDMLSPEDLEKLWRIGLKAARRTLKATSHKCTRTPGNLTRQFKSNRAHMPHKKLATREGSFYVDTLFSKIKLIRGYTCGNLYTTPLGFKKFFPMESKT